jgi:hypothetical protein
MKKTRYPDARRNQVSTSTARAPTASSTWSGDGGEGVSDERLVDVVKSPGLKMACVAVEMAGVACYVKSCDTR